MPGKAVQDQCQVESELLAGYAADLKSWHVLGKIEGKRRKRVTEEEMVGWHHRQGSLVCRVRLNNKKLEKREILRNIAAFTPTPAGVIVSVSEHKVWSGVIFWSATIQVPN